MWILKKAFATAAEEDATALIVGADPLFVSKAKELVGLAARHAVPAIYEFRVYAALGGLMSYGPSLPEGYRQAGMYVARILKGEKPADLPVIEPIKFDFVINLNTAKTLRITVPPALLARADEVIE